MPKHRPGEPDRRSFLPEVDDEVLVSFAAGGPALHPDRPAEGWYVPDMDSDQSSMAHDRYANQEVSYVVAEVEVELPTDINGSDDFGPPPIGERTFDADFDAGLSSGLDDVVFDGDG